MHSTPGAARSVNKTKDYPDKEGISLSGIEEASTYGSRVARELAAEGRWKTYVIVVTDENGMEIVRIPVAQ